MFHICITCVLNVINICITCVLHMYYSMFYMNFYMNFYMFVLHVYNAYIILTKNINPFKQDEVKERKYPLYTDIFADYEPQIPQINSDLFNLAYKRHKMGQIHKWIFPLMNTVSYLHRGWKYPAPFFEDISFFRTNSSRTHRCGKYLRL